MSLRLKLCSMKVMISSGTLEEITPEDYEEMGKTPSSTKKYSTDGVAYDPEFTNSYIEPISFDFEDSVFLLEDERYVHSSWVASAHKLEINHNTLVIEGKYYDKNLVEVEVTVCKKCGRNSPLIKDSKLCKPCFEEKFSKVNQYSYKPAPIFIGKQLPTDADTPVWYGIELELSCKDQLNVAEFQYTHSKAEKVFYYKHDGSIRSSAFPVELVTHPHSFSALMGATWLNSLNDLNVVNDSYSKTMNGCHIHISSTAFTDDKHYSKWYFFVYSLANGVLQKIANRECTRYCQNIKTGHILTKTKDPVQDNQRAVIINERNQQTKEVRMFSSTTDPKVLKSYIQFLESTIKYAKYANTKLSYDNWVAYLNKYSTKYEELLLVVAGISILKPSPLIIPNKEVYADSIFDIPTKYLSNIMEIEFTNDNTTQISICTTDFANEKLFINGRSAGIDFSAIKRIKYAK